MVTAVRVTGTERAYLLVNVALDKAKNRRQSAAVVRVLRRTGRLLFAEHRCVATGQYPSDAGGPYARRNH
ncbi:hypothetical protein [Candidatus Williamhamiltonella defendens]|uniref:hypothetical protein n=1 Tax=Candidatus Williamhamiltonella defendens TaxID=138072 RepID=UPI001F1E781B|nr:hypothetical protein [Candidatus Hamiltonella defensa]